MDGNAATRWCADSEKLPQHWQVDLGPATTVGFVRVLWEKDAGQYDFRLLVSTNGRDWTLQQAELENKGAISELTFQPA